MATADEQPAGEVASARRHALSYDVATTSTWRDRLRRSWYLRIAVIAGLAAVGLLVIPLLLIGHRFADTLARHPLEDRARQAQPEASQVFDSGLVSDDRQGPGFALGVSTRSVIELLAAPPKAPWAAGPAAPETPDTKYFRDGDLLLTLHIGPCTLARCKPGEVLVYTEVRRVD